MCVLSLILEEETHVNLLHVRTVCVWNISFTVYRKEDGGVSLKVAFFLFRQQASVRMRPFTECVLTSRRGACAVLNISVCAKSFANKAIKRQKVEVTTSGANTGSCRRELHLPPLLTTPGTNRVPQGFDPKANITGPQPSKRRSRKTELARVVTCVSLSFPAATAARRRNKETDINKTKLKAIIV